MFPPSLSNLKPRDHLKRRLKDHKMASYHENCSPPCYECTATAQLDQLDVEKLTTDTQLRQVNAQIQEGIATRQPALVSAAIPLVEQLTLERRAIETQQKEIAVNLADNLTLKCHNFLMSAEELLMAIKASEQGFEHLESGRQPSPQRQLGLVATKAAELADHCARAFFLLEAQDERRQELREEPLEESQVDCFRSIVESLRHFTSGTFCLLGDSEED